MASRNDSHLFARTCVLLAFVIIHVTGEEGCDKTQCPGPLKYYEGLGCTPVYKNPGDCCAESYNCDHLKNLAKDKCHVNGHEYSIGEALREEDGNPCDVGCICTTFDNVTASFSCAALDCAFLGPRPNCFYRHSYDQCCPGPFVCLEEGEERATCVVDGKTYLDGETFSPKSDPDLDCSCLPGYKGENVEPFCRKPKHPHCSPLFRNAADIHQNCAPVFYDGQNPQTDCNVMSRCQDTNDTVIHNHDATKSHSEEETMTCKFGDMVMHIGDELSQGTDYNAACVKCVCEVPPVPTCKRLPESECSYTIRFD